MGGLCFKTSSPPEQRSDPQDKINSRKVTVREEELVIAKLKVQADRLESRVKKLENEESKIQAQIRDLVKIGKKEEAYFFLRKLKTTKEFQKDSRNKLNFIDNQIANIENTLDDVKFTQVIKDSNRAIENLSKQIDTDELKIAKELQEEGKMRREDIEALLNDEEEDQAIKEELDMIEKGMLEDNFAQAEAKIKQAGQKQKTKQTKAPAQEQRVAMLN